MKICRMREAISDVYPGEAWKRRVENMLDDQVLAIYNSFAQRGMFDKKIEKRDPSLTKNGEYDMQAVEKKKEADKYKGVQLSFSDFLIRRN